ncbi:putative NADH-flavin reductase [Haloactinopolyspora alba]|uniref:Putative NADH-flavin reductase n=1 Tax=Haloactinopolyspora alba TaxID=648780 RepID=A0A2P8DY95_9ACTN|nr:NAD(P)H-binding protein [Haloactinopolyspora alba]PSL02195.1 putative NADH-flavin reductase [Haloactinopolyspora alba]
MHIAVLGATGRTGRHLVDQALDRGHTITAVVRDPARLPRTSTEQLNVATADVMDPAALAAVLTGHDAVVSAIGPVGRGPSSACTDSARALTEAMPRAAVGRLVVISAAGITTAGDGPFTRIVVKPLLNRFLRHSFADMRGMEREVTGSDLDWTIVRPPQLTDRPFTGRYRRSVGSNVRRGFRVCRADLAHAVLDAADDSALTRTTLSVAA